MRSPAWLYLDLLKKSILEELYVENELRLIYLRSCLERQEDFRQEVFLDIRRHRPAMYDEYVKLREVGINYGRTIQNLGFQHSMIGRRRLENIESCLETILSDGIVGGLFPGSAGAHPERRLGT
jgi:hypothetical protein